MALFHFCKTPAGPIRVTRIQLVLYCFLLSLIIYFLYAHKAAVGVKSPHPIFRGLGKDKGRVMTDMTVIKSTTPQTPLETPWGAPLVWGDTRKSAGRRAKFAQEDIRIGLLAVVVGIYAKFVQRFLSSAESHFLPGEQVTYYILTDNPNSLYPPIELGPERQLKVIPIAELPGWDRLARRRMTLLADAIRNPISSEVEYIFCADIDQEFLAPVGEEILGDLVATLHPELYGMPRNTFPYEVEEDSSACVEEDEGDYYYTSELYGGLVSEMNRLARACSLLILADQANGVMARGLEESYLNRYLIDNRPTCVLSPEYSWWDSALAPDVPVQRLVSLGRKSEALDKQSK
ncbi:globoside alpha-1,3-N-acetylgalactosaminyltransferase 1-like isoform X1 [Sebastes umbrosus]|uniref:globoside alpha-1,3-N-acetylgalactosaminyltransferase 1-like isoform X1 n=1 Tax=Sebastes umbrosus TaxID=72105 RepID=UPI0018A0106E|nr:globoside alpha-1,3-N-acetylgalactosaminyltransferase 1-like isoform X1 [Sebastes umbrosus]XP_037636496.1 globoside alpha-1,3-N-acetylgalactosaminyltransferase 1-like isoform X1 [Sebastes umbrosus]XP_037636503.1 globoside alpha-1,3-N-acetylgalactosaminyltransferase 1-like isoform X1 [Sebastes umbrosus]XP_037636512.1 globoside alpha-1,3-N-acetylgalactosaminyltransferase 1-like isoform X1 [Sebastes umbrosus]